MIKNEKYPRWMFIVLPSLAMMLGWGLRGHIGGGPFGAMVPGAMVAISLCLLLDLPAAATSAILVFGVVGVGLGGEMTYGQTLGFLRNPGTVWWGTLGTTVKGAVWGLFGGTVIALGFISKQVSKRTVVIAFLLLFAGMLIGFKLINEPRVIYFSGPDKPRAESWAAILLGTAFMLIWLKNKIEQPFFRLVLRFALFGFIGGGLGFGLGGFWMVMGSCMPQDIIFHSWCKAMEFTFGALFGAALGYAVWLSRNQLKIEKNKEPGFTEISKKPVYHELGIVLIAGLLIYAFIPYLLDPFVDAAGNADGWGVSALRSIAKILVNYAFLGFILILISFRFPRANWQLGITLTFCYAAIDLIRDFYPDTPAIDPFTMRFLLIFIMTAIVAVLTAYFSRQQGKLIRNIFLLLIWSCITVSFLRLTVRPESLNISGLSACEMICGKFIVDLFFLVSATVLSWMIIKKIRYDE